MGHLLLKTIPIPVILLLAVACESTGNGGAVANSSPDGGQALYEKSCSRCHALYMPMSYSSSEWKYYVGKYGRKARLTQHQRQVVYDYLADHARVLALEPNGP